MHFKKSSAKWQPFCVGFKVLNLQIRKTCISLVIIIHWNVPHDFCVIVIHWNVLHYFPFVVIEIFYMIFFHRCQMHLFLNKCHMTFQLNEGWILKNSDSLAVHDTTLYCVLLFLFLLFISWNVKWKNDISLTLYCQWNDVENLLILWDYELVIILAFGAI